VTRAQVRVTGRVQGVYFRAEAAERATALGVGGWVRNAPDGAVEAVFEGPDERVESLVAWCRRGPAGARVDDVAVTWEEPRGEARFRVVG
jgi:acylphosphatase